MRFRDTFCYLLFLLPKKLVSFIAGKLLHVELPSFLAIPCIKAFSALYRIDEAEAAGNVSDYPSIGAFFTRELKPGRRPVAGDFVSPVDGVLRNCGRVEGVYLPQVKEVSYTVSDLLGNERYAGAFGGGLFFSLYLSPRDYHHVHSPVSGQIVEARCIPGHLWPVNEWSLSRIEGVFVRNERVVTFIKSGTAGFVAVVMVGAFNVGRISVTYDNFVTNDLFSKRSPGGFSSQYHPGKEIRAGERLGTFHLGSSVIVLVEHDSPLCRSDTLLRNPGTIRFGERLILTNGSSSSI